MIAPLDAWKTCATLIWWDSLGHHCFVKFSSLLYFLWSCIELLVFSLLSRREVCTTQILPLMCILSSTAGRPRVSSRCHRDNSCILQLRAVAHFIPTHLLLVPCPRFFIFLQVKSSEPGDELTGLCNSEYISHPHTHCLYIYIFFLLYRD